MMWPKRQQKPEETAVGPLLLGATTATTHMSVCSWAGPPFYSVSPSLWW